MSPNLKRTVCSAVALLFCFALCRAAKFHFQDKEEAILKACSDQLQALGGNRAALKTRYPTPEIQLISNNWLAPGSTGEVVVKGKFVPDTKFVFENDNFEVVKESQSGNEYRATIRVPEGIGPQSAALLAVTPVTGLMDRKDSGAIVCGKYEWTLEAANGWQVVARSPANKVCGGNVRDDVYDVTFFKRGETKPFETRSGTLNFSVYEQVYRFAVSQAAAPQGQGSATDMQALAMKMADPKTTPAERAEIMKRLQDAQQQMMTQMQANMKQKSDPSYAQKQEQLRQQFGCERIELTAQGGGLTGRMQCSQTVGTQLAMTGTMKFLGR